MRKTCNAIADCHEEKHACFQKNGYAIMECKTCSHRFLDIPDTEHHLEKVYSDDYFFGGKDMGYPNYLEQKDILFNYGTRYAAIISKHMEPGKVLDTGCAAGFILKGFEASGWECYGVEPNDTMASYGRDYLHLPIDTGGFENFKSEETFDLINMIQVIGHFYDIDKAMVNVTSLLKINGLVLVESWNMKSIMARLLKSKWPEYSPPSVVSWFSDATLTELFNYYGFELIDHGYPAKKINLRHALSIFEEKTPDFKFKKVLVKSLDKSLGNFTVAYPPIDLKWYIFRKNN